MQDNQVVVVADTTMANSQPLVDDRPDLLWGAGLIGEYIGVSKRTALHFLKTHRLPAQKVGGRWVASRPKLKAFLEGEGA